jgi:hypothetical protein
MDEPKPLLLHDQRILEEKARLKGLVKPTAPVFPVKPATVVRTYKERADAEAKPLAKPHLDEFQSAPSLDHDQATRKPTFAVMRAEPTAPIVRPFKLSQAAVSKVDLEVHERDTIEIEMETRRREREAKNRGGLTDFDKPSEYFIPKGTVAKQAVKVRRAKRALRRGFRECQRDAVAIAVATPS